MIPGFLSHPELWVPGVTRKFGFPEEHGIRVPGVTLYMSSRRHRESGFSKSPGTLGSWSQTEDSVLGESPEIRLPGITRNPCSWRHPEYKFPNSPGMRFPGVTCNSRFLDSPRTQVSRNQTEFRVRLVTRTPRSLSHRRIPGSRSHSKFRAPVSIEEIRLPVLIRRTTVSRITRRFHGSRSLSEDYGIPDSPETIP